MLAHTTPTGVSTGDGDTWTSVSVAPLPSRPAVSSPQQNAAPSVVTPHEELCPAEMLAHFTPAGVSTGDGDTWTSVAAAPLPS